MEKLRAYINQQGDAPMRKAAARLGVSRPYLYDLLRGSREPSLEVALQIEEATSGSITVSDWPKFAKIGRAVHPDRIQGGAA